ncbi:hypothetical protein RB595_000407 [Gaeumannomyces hyphopodioides]
MADSPSAQPAPPHNRYAGAPNAWQLGETIPVFVARLPPLTTTGFPWIFVDNPLAGGDRALVDNDAAADGGTLMDQGSLKLACLASFADAVRAAEKTKVAASRRITPRRRQTAQEILELAQRLKYTTGKWMLFISPQNVNEVWAKIARATSAGELGSAAKVATGGMLAPPDLARTRLICVYTRDFADLDDVGRVLGRLKELGFAANSQIYYKPDVFTILGIDTGNAFNIRPSIYGSKNISDLMEERVQGRFLEDDAWVSYVESN